MKKLIPLMLGMALTFGAITTFASPQKAKSTKTKSTKAPKTKSTKKS